MQTSNDQGAKISPATTLANIASAVAMYRAAGFLCVTPTPLSWIPGDPPGFAWSSSENATVVDALRAGIPGIYGDAIADWSALSQMACPGADYDGVYRVSSSGTYPGHPTAAGADVLSACVAAAILTL